jgi:hypothetical protein
VCTSSGHAEVNAACELFKTQLWLGTIVDELMPLEDAEHAARYTIKEDAEVAIAWATAPNVSAKTRHFSVKYYFMKESVDEKLLRMVKVATTDQVADIFTKALGRVLFEKHRNALGVVGRDTYDLGGEGCRKVTGWC